MNNKKGLSIAGMIIGIVSAVISWPLGLMGIPGLILTSKARKNGQGTKGMNTAGTVTSVIGIVGFFIGTIIIITICVAGNKLTYGNVDPNFTRVADWTINWMETRYGEDFEYELPKRTIDTNGTGIMEDYTRSHPGYDVYYIKVKWTGHQLPNGGVITQYVMVSQTNPNDIQIRDDSTRDGGDAFQSIKFSEELTNELKNHFPSKYKLRVDYQNWAGPTEPVYQSYQDYFADMENGHRNSFQDVNIQISADESQFDSNIKKDIENMIQYLPANLKGKIEITSSMKGHDNAVWVKIHYANNTADFSAAEIKKSNWHSILETVF